MAVHSHDLRALGPAMETTRSAVTVAELVAAVRRQQTHLPVHGPMPGTNRPRAHTSAPADRRAVSVVGAYPGAGATSVATALADAAAETVESVSLINSHPNWAGGLPTTAEHEVESTIPMWREGRRGRTRVFAPAGDSSCTMSGAPSRSTVAPARPSISPAMLGAVTVLDGPHEAATCSVVVCRATIPSVQSAELSLTAIGTAAALVVLGSRRWPKPVAALLGPAIRHLQDTAAVVFFPPNKDLLLQGPDTTRVPAPLLSAGVRLVGVLWPDLATSPRRSHRHEKGVRP